jgi:hypothetical protein
MKKTLPIDQLQVGMYVILPQPWLDHPFLHSKFKLDTPKALAQLRIAGIREVTVDFTLSDVPPPDAEPRARARGGHKPAREEAASPPPASISELSYVSHSDTPPDPRGDAPPQWRPEELVPPEM